MAPAEVVVAPGGNPCPVPSDWAKALRMYCMPTEVLEFSQGNSCLLAVPPRSTVCWLISARFALTCPTRFTPSTPWSNS